MEISFSGDPILKILFVNFFLCEILKINSVAKSILQNVLLCFEL